MLEALVSAKMISPLHLAVKSGNLEAIQILLKVLPIDVVDKNGYVAEGREVRRDIGRTRRKAEVNIVRIIVK